MRKDEGYVHRGSSVVSRLSWVAAVALFSVLSACATVDGRSTPYIGAPHPPPSDPASIALLHEPPAQPHDPLGEVVVDASTQPAPPMEQIEGRLRGEAAKLGADAVVIVMDRVVPIGFYAAGPGGPIVDTVTGRRVVGVAIKYRT
jgi:hypothetical protein